MPSTQPENELPPQIIKSPFGKCVPDNPPNPFGIEGISELICDIESFNIDITSTSSSA